MKLRIICGSNDILVNQERDRVTSQWSGPIERVDLSESTAELATMLRSPSLFGDNRHLVLDHLEASEKGLEALDTYASSSDAVAVACWRGAVRAKDKERLGALGDVLVVSAGKVGDRITAMAKGRVELSDEALGVLVDRLGEDWGRVSSVLDQLVGAGVSRPSARVVATLCGSASASVAVWDVTDALTKGRLREGLALVERVEPVVLANWIGKETVFAARIAEGGWNAARAESELGVSAYRARNLVAWVKRSRVDWARAIADAAALDIAAKRGVGVLEKVAAWAGQW